MKIRRNFAKFQENAEIQHFLKSFMQFCANAQRKSFCIVQKKSAQATSTRARELIFSPVKVRAKSSSIEMRFAMRFVLKVARFTAMLGLPNKERIDI